jgi:hypothetical protein
VLTLLLYYYSDLNFEMPLHTFRVNHFISYIPDDRLPIYLYAISYHYIHNGQYIKTSSIDRHIEVTTYSHSIIIKIIFGGCGGSGSIAILSLYSCTRMTYTSTSTGDERRVNFFSNQTIMTITIYLLL